MRNGYTNYANAWPSYSYSRSSLTGLGIRHFGRYAELSGGQRSELDGGEHASAGARFRRSIGPSPAARINYSYTQSGTALAIGTPTPRNFASNEYAGYVSDSWRVQPGLTLTYGLRYENNTPPWETNGLQTSPTFALQDFWAQRLGGALAGIPSSQLPNARNTYSLIGPANGQPSWFGRQNQNFAPGLRLPTARSPIAAWEPRSWARAACSAPAAVSSMTASAATWWCSSIIRIPLA